MQTLIRTAVLAGALVVASTALAAEAKQTNKPVAADAAKTGVVIPSDEQAFLERLHFANQQEIKLGNLAKEKATMPQVKEFAQHMITAHTKADQDLMAYAKTKNIALDVPKAMNDTEQKVMDANKAKVDELQALQGKAFDAAYLTTMVGDHDMVLSKLIAGEQQFKGAGCEPMIKKLIPEIRMHRADAYKLLGQVAPKTA